MPQSDIPEFDSVDVGASLVKRFTSSVPLSGMQAVRTDALIIVATNKRGKTGDLADNIPFP